MRSALNTGSSTLENDIQAAPALERHYSPAEVAKLWGLSTRTVTRMFEDEPGVLAWGNADSGKARCYRTLRIPQSVLLRIHERQRQR